MITDVSSSGSPIYYDFDSFEEMNISTGGSDITVQTGGVVVNLVTRRGGNRLNLGGRFFVSDENYQSENLTEALKKEGVQGTNKIEDIRDYGFNLGGPLITDRAWAWISYGVQDIKKFTIINTKDDNKVISYNAKINLQIVPENRFEAFGTYQKLGVYPLGSPVLKLQDEHMFGDNLFLSGKFTYVNSGFLLNSMYNQDLAKVGKYNITTAQWDTYNYEMRDSRPRHDFSLLANYFNDHLFGLSHEIKVGGEISARRTYTKSARRASYYYNYNRPTVDTTGDNKPDIVPGIAQVRTSRYGLSASSVDAMAAYFSDTITKGRFNIILGLRYDRQVPKSLSFPVVTDVVKDSPAWSDNFTAATADAINKVMPPFEVGEVKSDYKWGVFSPRLGITWDVQSNGKTIAKLSFSQYGNFMTTGDASYFRPLGTSGSMYFWWLDDNKDGITDYRELYWHNSKTYKPYRVFDNGGNFTGNWHDAKNIMWSGFDPYNPTQTAVSTYTVDESAGSTRTNEVIFSLERELFADLGVGLNLTYRMYDHEVWNLDYYPTTGHIQSKNDYVQVGTIPSNVGPYSTGEAAGKPYYFLAGDQAATSFSYRTRQPDYYRKFFGADFIFNKRLSHRWMVNGSLTWQWQRVNYGENGYLNPTNNWALDKRVYAPYLGGSAGKISQNVFSRWLLKLSGLYQLPWDMSVGLSLYGREGNIIDEYFTLVDYSAPNPRNRSMDVYIEKFGKLLLPAYFNISLRVEKMFKAGDNGRIYLMADVFNAPNFSTIIRRYARNLGTYYVHNQSFVPNPTNYLANEILNPRVFRLGMRFVF